MLFHLSGFAELEDDLNTRELHYDDIEDDDGEQISMSFIQCHESNCSNCGSTRYLQ